MEGPHALREAALLADALQELHDLAESAEVEQWELNARFLLGGSIAVVGPAQGNGGMGAVRQAKHKTL